MFLAHLAEARAMLAEDAPDYAAKSRPTRPHYGEIA